MEGVYSSCASLAPSPVGFFFFWERSRVADKIRVPFPSKLSPPIPVNALTHVVIYRCVQSHNIMGHLPLPILHLELEDRSGEDWVVEKIVRHD